MPAMGKQLHVAYVETLTKNCETPTACRSLRPLHRECSHRISTFPLGMCDHANCAVSSFACFCLTKTGKHSTWPSPWQRIVTLLQSLTMQCVPTNDK